MILILLIICYNHVVIVNYLFLWMEWGYARINKDVLLSYFISTKYHTHIITLYITSNIQGVTSWEILALLWLGIHCLSSHTYSLTRGGIQTLTLTDKYYIYILPKWIITLHVPITQYGYITLPVPIPATMTVEGWLVNSLTVVLLFYLHSKHANIVTRNINFGIFNITEKIRDVE